MTDLGWVKLHRSLLEWEWYDDIPTKLVFIHLLLTANYKASKYRGVDVPAGSVVTGRMELAKATGLTENQIRTAITKLKNTSEITSNAYAKFSVISITNWSVYQDDNQQATSKPPASHQQTTTSKEGKKVRREELDIFDGGKDLFDDSKSDFDEFWTSYGKVGPKEPARKKYALARKDATREELLEAVKNYQATMPEWQNPCHASTWLNQKRWRDHLVTKSDPEDAAKARWGEAIDKWQKNGKQGPMPSKHDFWIE